MDNESIKLVILTEAAKCANQIYKVKSASGDFIKLKHSYSQPDDVRSDYLLALNSLQNAGLVRQVFTTDDIELYEVTERGRAFTTLSSAMNQIKDELASSGRVFKIHSEKGEFLQCGAVSHNKIDSERILYLQALHMLLHHGIVRVVSETRSMATYEIDRTNQLYCDQSAQREHDSNQFAA